VFVTTALSHSYSPCFTIISVNSSTTFSFTCPIMMSNHEARHDPFPDTPTAISKVFQNPELLSMIIEVLDLYTCCNRLKYCTYRIEAALSDYIGPYDEYPMCIRDHRSAMYKCVLVSRLWSSAALKRLWGFYADMSTLKHIFSLPKLSITSVSDS